ncbi:hypothetical protein MK805_15430 [Shimazuella sp. AN120528]|uniref:hypothetical protein n=1 Tax=Shimazuella soli TaxID=1892854 RepID=UPI001F0D0874|nr:hypothetical protein [Shimazuella soli]MCH5586334.1 hypothetical protein [Shimazuella soli]
MDVKLTVEGDREKVCEFVDSILHIPQWRYKQASKIAIGGDLIRVDYFFNEKPVKPSIRARKISKLSIKSAKGNFDIDLLDAEVVQLGNGNTFIHGKSYDIFSPGTVYEQNLTEKENVK